MGFCLRVPSPWELKQTKRFSSFFKVSILFPRRGRVLSCSFPLALGARRTQLFLSCRPPDGSGTRRSLPGSRHLWEPAAAGSEAPGLPWPVQCPFLKPLGNFSTLGACENDLPCGSLHFCSTVSILAAVTMWSHCHGVWSDGHCYMVWWLWTHGLMPGSHGLMAVALWVGQPSPRGLTVIAAWSGHRDSMV